MASNLSSRGSNSRGRGNRICFCGVRAVIRTARTRDNYGRSFWGCPNYEHGDDCSYNYFHWVEDENEVEENTRIMLMQVRRIEQLQNKVRQTRSRIHMMNWCLFLSVFFNVLLMVLLWAKC